MTEIGPGDPAEPKELLGRLVCQLRNEFAAMRHGPGPDALMPWDRLPQWQRELDMLIGDRLFERGKAAGAAAAQLPATMPSRQFVEMQHVLVAILHQAGQEGLLITAKTFMTMPSDAYINEQDTDEGKRLWISQIPSSP